MSAQDAAQLRSLTLARGRKVSVAERGAGKPLLYLHDIADIHGASTKWSAFHGLLAAEARLIAPAHPGCAGSDEDHGVAGIDDVVFGLLETLDALGLDSVDVVGIGVGGWLAAELAVRHRRLVEKLVLVNPAGLFVSGQPTTDIFTAVFPRDGHDHGDLRRALFASADSAAAREHVPDGRAAVDREVLRYQMFRFIGRVGFNPPFLYHRHLADRLHRFDRPALVVAGVQDGLVPAAHARAFAERLPAATLVEFADAGHSVHLEKPAELASAIRRFLA